MSRINVEHISEQGCALRASAGLGAGATLGVLAAGLVVAWRGPLGSKLTPLAHLRQLAGSMVPTGALVGVTYPLVECITEDARGKQTPFNAMVGGCAAGAALGLQRRSARSAVAFCGGFGAVAGAADFYDRNAQTPAERVPARSPEHMNAGASAIARHVSATSERGE